MIGNSDAEPGADNRSSGPRGAELREANEQLILAALHAEAVAESAVSHLDELARSLKHDALTGTPNRALMLDRLENAIAFAKRHGTRVAVLFLDLDEFKQINDTFGHAVGDAAVELAARRLELEVRESDTISRHGGDEFVVLLAEVADPSDAALVAGKILAALGKTSRIDNHPISLSASIGIALFPDDATDAATLITNADAAMYRCKNQGGGAFQFYGNVRAQARSFPSPPRAKKTLREANAQLLLSALSARKITEQTRQKHARQISYMAMVAHQLRNALVPMKTATGVLNRAHADELIKEAHDILERQAAHMCTLIEDLLASARVGTRNFRVAMSHVDIIDVITRAIEVSRPAVEAKHQQLMNHLPHGPLIVLGDASRLAQIFGNLLDNACKYTPEGGEISVTGELREDAIVIAVSDNGIGIPPDRLTSIFELFVRHESTTTVSGSLGIGLAVARDLVEAHGGTIVARSRGENLGSAFTVTLPIGPVDSYVR